MIKHILSSFFLSIAIIAASNAQQKVDKYVQVIVRNKNGLSDKRVAVLNLGDYKKLIALKDTSIFEKLRLVNNLTTETDVLNYMTILGWTLVDIHSGSLYTANEIIYFKKQFDSSELNQ